MIKLLQPSLVLHSHDVPGYKYRMQTTWQMPKGASASDVVFWILHAIDHSPEKALKNVVINCHGGPGALYVGGASGPTISIKDVGLFNQLRTKDLGTLWIVACEVALGGNGLYFCSCLAKTLGCDVVASDTSQFVEGAFYEEGCPYGQIDDYEGTTYRFSPSGKIAIYSIRASD